MRSGVKPQARIDGVTVQPMISKPKARELIAGLARDPTFGVVVLFGQGGIAVEAVDDKAIALPPLDLSRADDLISRTRISRLLKAYRNVPAARRDQIALVLVRLSQLAADIPEILELDINPLLADETGVHRARCANRHRSVGTGGCGRRPILISRSGPIRRNGSAMSRCRTGG